MYNLLCLLYKVIEEVEYNLSEILHPFIEDKICYNVLDSIMFDNYTI